MGKSGQCHASRRTPWKARKRLHVPEVCPQIQHLPDPKADEKESGAETEPLDTVVGALVSIPQLLLPRSQVVHLADNLGHHLLHSPQVGLDWLELLGCLDRGPVLGVGADIDVQLDVAGRVVDLLGCLSRPGNQSPLIDFLFALSPSKRGPAFCHVGMHSHPVKRFSKQTSNAASE